MYFCIKKLEVVTKDLRQQYEKAVYVSLLLVTDGPIPKERSYQWREKKKRKCACKSCWLGRCLLCNRRTVKYECYNFGIRHDSPLYKKGQLYIKYEVYHTF